MATQPCDSRKGTGRMLFDYPFSWFQPKPKTARRLLIACGCWLSLSLYLLLAPIPVQPSAHAMQMLVAPENAALTLSVDMGFDGYYRVGYWTPVRVTMENSGANFSGRLALNTFSARSATNVGAPILSPWSFTQPVTLPRGARKTITLTIPIYVGSSYHPFGVVAKLLDAHGRTVAMQEASPEYAGVTDIFIGVLSNNSAGLNTLNSVALPNRGTSILLASLDKNTFPTTTAVLASFDMIILDNFATSTLSAAQLRALETWVNQGGALIEVGGADWSRTLQPLPTALLPISVSDTTTLPAGTHLLPAGINTASAGDAVISDTLPAAIPASAAMVRTAGQGNAESSVTILASGTMPLLVQARHGQGVICYLAFDPALPVFANWPAIATFWKSMLLRMVGDRALLGSTPVFASGPGDLIARGGLLDALQPPVLFSPQSVGLLLLLYIILLVVAGVVIVRHLKRPQWRWRITLSVIVVFSLFSYALFSYQHRTALLDNTLSIVQLSTDGSPAQSTTYHGVFVPDSGDFQMRLPASSLILPVPYPLTSTTTSVFSEDDPRVAITPSAGNVSVHVSNTSSWSFHAFVSQQNVALPGGILAHVSLTGNRLVGTVTNTLNTSLNDAYILLPHAFVSLGNLAGGETLSIDAPLQPALTRPGATLADALAVHAGLHAPYFPYDNNEQPQNDEQRHMALLAALGGIGFAFPPCEGPCMTQTIVSRGEILTSPPGTPSTITLPNDSDPLLLNGAAATLIGWATAQASPLDNGNAITINDATPRGFHDTLVQLPLNLGFAGALQAPSDVIVGYVVNEQDSDAEDTTPATYSLTTGSLTFEFDLPVIQPASLTSLTLREPDELATTSGAIGQSGIPDQALASLYNWQTLTWDTVPLTQWTFVTSHPAAYISPDGRALLQIANKDPGSLLLFSKPSLSLSGNVSGSV